MWIVRMNGQLLLHKARKISIAYSNYGVFPTGGLTMKIVTQRFTASSTVPVLIFHVSKSSWRGWKCDQEEQRLLQGNLHVKAGSTQQEVAQLLYKG